MYLLIYLFNYVLYYSTVTFLGFMELPFDVLIYIAYDLVWGSELGSSLILAYH